MIKLYDLSDNSLSKGIKNLSPILYDAIQIENDLLSGESHIQTIGTPRKYKTFEILANQNQVDSINYISSIGGVFKLVVDTKYYIGFCKLSDWQRATKRYPNETDRFYTNSIRINILEEGII